MPAKLNVVSVGPHARRSRLLFRRAFGRQTQVGVVSVPNPDYDPQRWWAYSIGFRTVVGESVGYLYVKLVFRRSEGTVLDAQESAAGAALSFAPRRGENAEPFAWRLAYDLAHRFKRLCLPPRYGHATLGTLRTDLLVVPAGLVRRGGRQRAAPAARLSPPRILRGGVSQGRGPAPVAGNMILSGRDRQNARISMGSASCQTIFTLFEDEPSTDLRPQTRH